MCGPRGVGDKRALPAGAAFAIIGAHRSDERPARAEPPTFPPREGSTRDAR